MEEESKSQVCDSILEYADKRNESSLFIAIANRGRMSSLRTVLGPGMLEEDVFSRAGFYS